MGLRWQTTDEWQCQAQQSARLRACLRMNSEDHSGLLRGEGIIAGNPQPLAFYHRVMADAAAAGGGIRPVAGGWLDFARMRRSWLVSRRNERPCRDSCSGFSLPETLVAALLFAVSLTGLLQYHQILQQSLLHQMQQRQAWRLAHQQLEIEGTGGVSSPLSVPDRWGVSREEQRHPPACRRVTVTVVTPYRYRAVLSRWFCDALTRWYNVTAHSLE